MPRRVLKLWRAAERASSMVAIARRVMRNLPTKIGIEIGWSRSREALAPVPSRTVYNLKCGEPEHYLRHSNNQIQLR